MQNIDPIYFITPITVIAFSFGLVIYCHYRRGFSKWVLGYSLAAYAGAIALKYLVQIPTIGAMDSAFGSDPAILGIYYGLQTGIFEVGGAFLVATIAVSKGHFRAKDAEGYGLGLALWENGVLLSIPLLIDYAAYYAILGTPNSSIAQTLYSTLSKDAPSLFYGPAGALPLVGYAILERGSSLFAHFSWGYLAVLAAVYKKRSYLSIAFPIGFLIDFLVPFSGSLGTGRFELLVFTISLVGLIAAIVVTRGITKPKDIVIKDTGPERKQADLGSLSSLNFRRSTTNGRIYLILSIALRFW